MIVNKFQTEEEWLDFRKGKIGGSSLSDIITKRGNSKKIMFYRLIADRVAVSRDSDEDPMARGHRLEKEALDRLEEDTGIKFDRSLVIWQREDNKNITSSPDGFNGKTRAAEAKCLSSERHIQALVENKIPNDYWDQVLQYFVVNDDLKELYVVFYDPDVLAMPYFKFVVKRKDIEEEVKKTLEIELKTLAEIDEITLRLSKF